MPGWHHVTDSDPNNVLTFVFRKLQSNNRPVTSGDRLAQPQEVRDGKGCGELSSYPRDFCPLQQADLILHPAHLQPNVLFGHVAQPLGGGEDVAHQDSSQQIPSFLSVCIYVFGVVVLAESQPGSGETVAVDLLSSSRTPRSSG